jgi:hypothetical protein
MPITELERMGHHIVVVRDGSNGSDCTRATGGASAAVFSGHDVSRTGMSGGQRGQYSSAATQYLCRGCAHRRPVDDHF